MDNIKYRVQYFNGTLDIVTAPGKGTSVNIELNA
jgi:signal transduction histidine kinase